MSDSKKSPPQPPAPPGSVNATAKFSDPDDGATSVPSYMRATLRVVHGAATGREFTLRGACTVIGRGEDADICIDDKKMSRGHAAISYHHRGREFRVDDLESANFTLLNGSRVTSYALRNGDKLLVGDTLLLFEVSADGAPTAEK